MIVRDPVHGDIEVGPEEREILDTPQLQRLRGIKQTGTACLVYPGCVHTRFEHSLGTMATAKRIMDSLERVGFPPSPEDRLVVAAAALVHDVTHIPFGHTFEDERRIFPRHDSGHRLQHFVVDSALGEILRRHGVLGPVLKLLSPSPEPSPGQAWRAQLISSCVDADLLDYLRRDAYFAGLSHNYDDRIFAHFLIADGQLALNLVKHEMERPDARSEIMHLLRLRYFLTERVYTHHAKIASGAMISRAVELARDDGLEERQLWDLSDQTLPQFLKALGGPGSPAALLVEAVEGRRLLKRAYILSSATVGRPRRLELIERYAGPGPERVELERQLARTLGLGEHQVAVCCPPESLFKEAGALVRSRGGIRPLNTLDPGPAGEVRSLEEQYENLWRFYVFVPPEHVGPAGRACEELLGEPNEYRPKGEAWPGVEY